MRIPTAPTKLTPTQRAARQASELRRDLPHIPERMKWLRRDARGFPVPYTQFVDVIGVPDFRVLDEGRLTACLKRRLCGVCGTPFGRQAYFIGGPLCVTNGIFCDAPMHKGCAIFCLQACPHLARVKGRYSAAALPQESKVAVGEMVTDTKSEWFALMHGNKYTFKKDGTGMTYIRAELPWQDVQRWQDGKPMEEETTS